MTKIGSLLDTLVTFVLPHLCLSCRAEVAAAGTLCATCWNRVQFLSAQACAVCGHPFEVPLDGDALCGACARSLPVYRRARAVFLYDEASKPLVLAFKHADRLDGAPAFARWMARAGGQLVEDADLIVPVPLHRWRLLARRYNQAAVLALALGRISGKTVVPDLLTRHRPTPAMGRMGRLAREVNVKAAFQVTPRHRDRLNGATVLLIDDVLTTGATVSECAAVLIRAGAAAVDVLTLARVVR